MARLRRINEAEYKELTPYLLKGGGASGNPGVTEIIEEVAAGKEGDKFVLKARDNPCATLKQLIQNIHGRFSGARTAKSPLPFRISVRRLKDESAIVILRLALKK